ncbi:hypothetical protein SDC9_107347 [bioreactor metagenome]|uniref:Uncharacterized protein n=1 Tax=bioreactor metagenome TaxID=1076179 RepID=A0A645B619_9ZZZZ
MHQILVITIGAPEEGITGEHAVERTHRPSSGLIHDVDGDTHLLILTLLEGPVAKLGMVGGLHLSKSIEDDMVLDDVVA